MKSTNNFKTPDKVNYRLQPGHIALHSKWQNSDIHRGLKELFNAAKVLDLRNLDFALPDLNIIYLPEDKLISGVDVARFQGLQEIVFIADRNTLTLQVYSQIQEALQPIGISLLPVGHSREVPLLLHQLCLAETVQSPASNFRPAAKLPAGAQLQLLLCIPGLGPQKAHKLLGAFGSVQKIAFCKVDELVPMVGPAAASQVDKFFNGIIGS